MQFFGPNLVAMATALTRMKFYIPYSNSPTPKTFYLCDKFFDFLHKTEISAIVAYFCLNLVAMATPLAPLKFWIAYLNSPIPKTLLKKVLDFLRRSEVCAILAYFCPNLVAMVTPLAPLAPLKF